MGEKRLNFNVLSAITSKGNPLEWIKRGPCGLLSGENADIKGPRWVNTSGGKGKPVLPVQGMGLRLLIEG